MRHGPLDRAPNYTVAALVMGLVNLLWIFFALWAVWGWPAVLVAAVLLNAAITWLERRLMSRRR